MRKVLNIFLFFGLSVCWAAPTVCLNMIVKDEEAVIQRCLRSVKPFINHWVIVDTGSSDQTMNLIREELKDIPGELHQREWVRFDVNRNQALQLAKNKCDYTLFIDADEILNVDNPHWKDNLDRDFYIAKIRVDKLSSTRFFLLKGDKDTYWEGAMHEKLKVEPTWQYEELKGIWVDASCDDGARSKDPQKYLKDALMIKKALDEDPTNHRLARYLAQTYYAAKEYEKTIESAHHRLSMGGWDEELYYCYFLIASAKQALDAPFDEVTQSYEKTIDFRPKRAESYFYLATYLASHNQLEKAFEVCKKALNLPIPPDTVNMNEWVYNWGVKLLYADIAHLFGKYDDALKVYEKALVFESDIPEETLPLIQSAMTRCKDYGPPQSQ